MGITIPGTCSSARDVYKRQVYSIYTEALLNLRIGYSAAIGVILLIIVSILTIIYFWGFSRKVHYQ